MKTSDWIKQNTASLKGKSVAVSGATGGIGCKLCRLLAALGARLILLDRNPEKSRALGESLQKSFPHTEISYITLDLEDISSVKTATEALLKAVPDVLILNAGAYHIPRRRCETGLDNVFQINFASPYYIVRRLKPSIRERGGRVVAVGSIAHNYSKTDSGDIDFSTRVRSSLVYGNAKRFLMFSLYRLFANEKGLAVVHPGITLTNITAHYPKLIFAIIKHPMKVLFMKPERAALNILYGVFRDTPENYWIGPRIFGIWGSPKYQRLNTCSSDEAERIFRNAEKIYGEMQGDYSL
ncbi:MAG: SDR family NAD(P)-dependent oxidoreductase [Clostridia bacterium]|nr:SDR family NAD(P)-dependent oxidoreductase [Clostridia bacterium]